MNVVVIDDEPCVCDAIGTSLSLADIETQSVRHKNHFDLIDLNNVDCVLIDFYLGDWDGVQVINQLQQKNFCGGILLMTGMSSDVINLFESAAMSAGLNYWGTIKKPIRQAELFTRLSAGEKGACQSDTYMPKAHIEQALHGGGLQVLFQPQVALPCQNIIGFEALSRLQINPTKTLSPLVFIELIERYHLSELFNEKLLEQGLSQLQHSQYKNYPVSFNFSAEHLTYNLTEKILQIANAHDYATQNLTIEVTEDKLMNAHIDAADALSRLTEHGVNVSLDDFGTGYNAFRQIAEFSFTELKLDKFYTQTCVTNRRSMAILETAQELADKLALKLIVEGVETQEQLQFLIEKGICAGQGYLFGKPAPINKQ